MDRRPPRLDPDSGENEPPVVDSQAAPPARLSEAEWDTILPPVDESDPKWQAYVKEKIREALDDPRPDIPAEEAFAEVYAHIDRRRAAKGDSD